MRKSDLRKYARLIAEMGVNIQPGQRAIISASVNDAEFVRLVVEACYKAGAEKVTVEWTDDAVTVLDYTYASVDTLKEFPTWKEEQWKDKAERLPAMIYIDSGDPDAFAGTDPDKRMEVRRELTPKIWNYRKDMEGHYQWSIVAMPGTAWAKKLFPELAPKAAREKLWQAIMHTSRLNGDPVQNWKAHAQRLTGKCKALNAMDIETLHIQTSRGTDMTIGLIKGSEFCAADSSTDKGVVFLPNIPTEECFTSPDRNTANGRVMASKPLSLMGNVLEDFGFVFENGRVTEVIARNDAEKKLLNDLIGMDEGAAYLGEVALVPFSSPVNETGILFYNTLFDENAVCHLALGRGFEEVVPGFEDMSDEEKSGYPINESIVHTDFMIGTADTVITAHTRDGQDITVFREGEWAI